MLIHFFVLKIGYSVQAIDCCRTVQNAILNYSYLVNWLKFCNLRFGYLPSNILCSFVEKWCKFYEQNGGVVKFEIFA
jgi:hypothetical protein